MATVREALTTLGNLAGMEPSGRDWPHFVRPPRDGSPRSRMTHKARSASDDWEVARIFDRWVTSQGASSADDVSSLPAMASQREDWSFVTPSSGSLETGRHSRPVFDGLPPSCFSIIASSSPARRATSLCVGAIEVIKQLAIAEAVTI